MTYRDMLYMLLAFGTAAQADPRIATRLYRPSEIVTLHGKAGIESTIAFAPDERIENIAVGNSAAWQVTPNKRANLLFVKPAVARAHTNMTVVTDQRTYLFDLVSIAGVEPVYMFRFSYPDVPKPVVVAAIPDMAVTIVEPAPPPPVPAMSDLNFDWRSRGDKRLLPARSFDNGRSVFLQWSADATLPAILVRDASGIEGPATFVVQGAYIVIEGVPAELILRSGKQMAVLTSGIASKPSDRAPDGTRTRALADARPGRPFAHVLDGRQ